MAVLPNQLIMLTGLLAALVQTGTLHSQTTQAERDCMMQNAAGGTYRDCRQATRSTAADPPSATTTSADANRATVTAAAALGLQILDLFWSSHGTKRTGDLVPEARRRAEADQQRAEQARRARATEDSIISARRNRRRELWLQQRAEAREAGVHSDSLRDLEPARAGVGRTMPDGPVEAFPGTLAGHWSPWFALQYPNGDELFRLDVAYFAGLGMASDLGDGTMTWAVRNRSETPVRLFLSVTRTCLRVCNSAIFEQVVTVPSGGSWTAPIVQGTRIDVKASRIEPLGGN